MRLSMRALLVLVVFAAACAQKDQDARGDARPQRSAPVAAATTAPRIVILGDSLTAGLGLPVERSYPARGGERLKAEGLNYDVVNAGVSGDTSAGGLTRLDWALSGDVRILVV